MGLKKSSLNGYCSRGEGRECETDRPSAVPFSPFVSPLESSAAREGGARDLAQRFLKIFREKRKRDFSSDFSPCC